jgi:hypothetical protein
VARSEGRGPYGLDSLTRRVIGGDFELSALSFGATDQLASLTRGLTGTWTASGRAALGLVLRHLQGIGVQHVHLPAYLCESVLFPVRALGLEYSFYPVDACLKAHPDPPPGAAVVLIHYFGWLNSATAALRAEAGQSFYLIEDASQALLSHWSAPSDVARFVILSPRKFGPVPMGGWCNVLADLEEPSGEVEALAWRSLAARLARAMYLVHPDAPVDPAIETFYLAAFRAVEIFLDTHPTSAAVPQIALDVIAGLDWCGIAACRRANWQYLSELLSDDVEVCAPDLPAGVVPLGYVVRLQERDLVRARLVSQRIFCPVHWSLPVEVSTRRFPDAALLAATCLTIPIDQRYGSDDMVRIVNSLRAAL